MSSVPRGSFFAPFRVRGFALQWPADLLTNIGIEMEILILGWFILVETKSVFLLTVFGALRYLGTLIAPVFGMAGDRFGHRNVLSAMRGSYAILAVSMTIVSFAGWMGPVPVFVAATISGLIRPSDLAMRNALIAVIMPPAQLMGAMGTARTTGDCSRIVGPLIGAMLMARFGMGASYLAIAVFYSTGFFLTGMGGAGLAHRRAEGVGTSSFVREVGEGLAFCWRTPCVHAGMWLAVLVNATVIPLTGGLMPYVARDIHHLDQFGLGCLLACFSVGAFIGSVSVSVVGESLPAARAMLQATMAWSVLVLLYVLMPNPYLAGLLLVGAGIAQNFCMIPLAVMQLRVSGEQYRGRVMGVRMFAIYGLPVGLLAAGELIGRIGFGATAVGYCVICFVATAAIVWHWRPAVWPIDAQGNRR